MSYAADALADARVAAARLASRAEIRDVRLLNSNVRLERLPEPGKRLTYKLDVETQVDRDPDEDEDAFVVRVKYMLTIAEQPDGETDNEIDPAPHDQYVIADLDFEQAGLFTLHFTSGEPPPSDDEFEAYSITTGQFALHPFAREYVYSMTGRLALPPLTIGVLHMPLPSGKESSKGAIADRAGTQ
jgi:hypothetical protein